MSCAFAQTETEYIPGVGPATIHIDGSVEAYLPH
jgi:hypothetical protein